MALELKRGSYSSTGHMGTRVCVEVKGQLAEAVRDSMFADSEESEVEAHEPVASVPPQCDLRAGDANTVRPQLNSTALVEHKSVIKPLLKPTMELPPAAEILCENRGSAAEVPRPSPVNDVYNINAPAAPSRKCLKNGPRRRRSEDDCEREHKRLKSAAKNLIKAHYRTKEAADCTLSRCLGGFFFRDARALAGQTPAYERESHHGKQIAISVGPSSLPANMRVTFSRIPRKNAR